MTDADRVLIDTNVLITASSPKRACHTQARRVFEGMPSGLFLSGQVVREYLVVATRRLEDNGLGLSIDQSLDNVNQFLERTTVLEEDQRVADLLRRLVADYSVTGKAIHDAGIVATALRHQVTSLLTENAPDFARYESLIRVVPLASG